MYQLLMLFDELAKGQLDADSMRKALISILFGKDLEQLLMLRKAATKIVILINEVIATKYGEQFIRQ